MRPNQLSSFVKNEANGVLLSHGHKEMLVGSEVHSSERVDALKPVQSAASSSAKVDSSSNSLR